MPLDYYTIYVSPDQLFMIKGLITGKDWLSKDLKVKSDVLLASLIQQEKNQDTAESTNASQTVRPNR